MRLGDVQRAAWEAIADGWASDDDLTTVRRCRECGQGIYLLTSVTGKTYSYTHVDILALTVLHLRNFHPGLDPDKPAQTL